MTLPPLVSIVMPTYNGARYLQDSLSSAQHQTWENLEIIVADDCSSDGTLDLLRSAAQADSRIRLLERPSNLGPALNQRELYAAARGEFLKPLLQDDLLEPDAVTRLIEPLIADPSLALATSRRRFIDQYGWPLPDGQSTAPLIGVSGRLNGQMVGDLILETTCNRIGEVSTVLLRRELVAMTSLWWWGSYSFTVNADIWLWLQLLSRGDLWYEAETLSSFRLHPGQSSAQARTPVIGVRDWVRLLEVAPSLGYLGDTRSTRAAVASVLAEAARQLSIVDHPDLMDMLDMALRDLLALLGHREGTGLGPREFGFAADRLPVPLALELVLRPDWSDLRSLQESVVAFVRAFDNSATSSLVIVVDETGPSSTGEIGQFVATTLTEHGHDPELVPEISVVEQHRLADQPDDRTRIWIGRPASADGDLSSPAPTSPAGYLALASPRRTPCRT